MPTQDAHSTVPDPGSSPGDGSMTGLAATPLRDLGLSITGSGLEPLVAQVEREMVAAGITRVRPHWYLSTEWGVPFGTVSVAIPFYLSREDLSAFHKERYGLVEGANAADILRYLRHEVGHVINYAYKLYERPDWTGVFGPFEAEYVEEYRPRAFSRDFVRHLPGWYAQKHPDEDWAETFAVWLTPGSDWQSAYAAWPGALAKLALCDRLMTDLGPTEPLEVAIDADEEVGDVEHPVESFYQAPEEAPAEWAGIFDGYAAGIFPTEVADGVSVVPASAVIKAIEIPAVVSLFRWTSHFPERTRTLLGLLAARADALHLVCRVDEETDATVEVITLVTALAMNFVIHGHYFPGGDGDRADDPIGHAPTPAG